jgi:hypothetical protein
MKTLVRIDRPGPRLNPETPNHEAGLLPTVGGRLFSESRGSTNGQYPELLQLSAPPPPTFNMTLGIYVPWYHH